jgi:hypothetical protein
LDEVRKKRLAFLVVGIVLFLFTLTSRVCIAYYLANDDPGDSVVYSRLAKNMLEQGVFSLDTE